MSCDKTYNQQRRKVKTRGKGKKIIESSRYLRVIQFYLQTYRTIDTQTFGETFVSRIVLLDVRR